MALAQGTERESAWDARVQPHLCTTSLLAVQEGALAIRAGPFSWGGGEEDGISHMPEEMHIPRLVLEGTLASEPEGFEFKSQLCLLPDV